MSTSDKDKAKKDTIKEELNKLLDDFDSTYKEEETGEGDMMDDEFNDMERSRKMMKFEEINPKLKDKAISVLDEMFKFYVDMDVIDKNEYTKRKKDLLATNLSGIFFQLKTVKSVLEKVAEEITAGDTTPRLIEAFGSLQDKYSNIIKSHANYLLFLEDTVRETLNTTPISRSKNIEAIEEGGIEEDIDIEKRTKDSKYYVSSSQKKMIEDLDVKEVEGDIEDEPEYKLVNPNDKTELMEKEGIDINLVRDRESEGLEDYDDLIDMM